MTMVESALPSYLVDRSEIARAAANAFSFDTTYGRKCDILLSDHGVQ